MDVAQEFIEVWNALMEQERAMIELRRSVLAMLDLLKSQPHLFDSYQTTFRAVGSSAVILRSERNLRDAEDKIHYLAAEKSAKQIR